MPSVDMQEIVTVRKHTAGADSYGHTWLEDGATVDMPRWQAYELLAIGGGGFEITGVPEVTEPDPAAEVTEPAPDDLEMLDEAPASRSGRGRRRAG